jgi:hypothetical protein
MDAHVPRQFLKEEELLETYYETIDEVLPWLGHDWRPNFKCSDQVRRHRARLLAAGRLAELTFERAVLFHGREGLSSIRLRLTVDQVLPRLGHNWCPNFQCNDQVRQHSVRLLAAGQLAELVRQHGFVPRSQRPLLHQALFALVGAVSSCAD